MNTWLDNRVPKEYNRAMSNPFEPQAYGLQKNGKIYCFMVNPFQPDSAVMVTFVQNESAWWEIHYRHFMTLEKAREAYTEFAQAGYRKRDMIQDPVNESEPTPMQQFAVYMGYGAWGAFETKMKEIRQHAPQTAQSMV